MLLIEFFNEVQRAPLHFVRDASRVGKKEHGVAGFAERHARVNRRQKSAAVKRRPSAEAPGGIEHHEPGQVLRLAPQPVEHPRAKTRTAKLSRAGLHQHLAGSVIEGVGGHGFNDGDVVHDLRQMRQGFRKFCLTLAMLRKLKLGGVQSRVGPDKGVLLALHDLRRERFAIVFCQRGFEVEQFELARRAGHKQVDHSLGLGRELRRMRRERVGKLRRSGSNSLFRVQQG